MSNTENKEEYMCSEKASIKGKFKDLKLDEGTKIIIADFIKIREYDARFEIWSWDGIYAFSLIFFKEDVKDINEQQLINLINEKFDISDNYTYKDNGKYIFLSFNFIVS
jgi:hypothetical protein